MVKINKIFSGAALGLQGTDKPVSGKDYAEEEIRRGSWPGPGGQRVFEAAPTGW